ncbi:MAG TPA: M28 family peptidase [Gemmatimonadaceae bacterium]|nr:M28 family peptidase [Gemmatimonadaceae bacterium]
MASHLVSASLLVAFPAALLAQPALPLKHAAKPTTTAISAADLMTRLYIFADDSMQGRETGTVGHLKSTAYIASELKRLGVQPGGDEGSYFQDVPMIRRSFDPTSTITVGSTTLKGGTDFIATTRGAIPSLDGAGVVFGGTAGDTTSFPSRDQIRGKIVVLKPAPGGGGFAGRGGGGGGAGRGQAALRALSDAVAIATVTDNLSPDVVRSATHPREGDVMLKRTDATPGGQLSLTITGSAAEALLGTPIDAATAGQAGKTVTASVRFKDDPAPARNVVAIIRGSDPKLRGQFVALGAHNDHVGFATQAVDHDSLHAYNAARFAIRGMVPRGVQPTAEQDAAVAAIKLNLDSLRAARPTRLDSIRNGADDDGSGSVMLLELAEAFQKSAVKPKRSLVFVWHVGEEKGLLGSRWYSDHPSVARDSIVAQLNMDMIGRGEARDLPVGSPSYLELVGSRRLSTELGDMVESVSKAQSMPFTFDYQYDANGHPENIYCRSDHYNYARWGIPVVFFTTGLHGDYHQVTDEPQYIDYPHMARIGQLVHEVAVKVANLDHRIVVDKEKPDPNGACRQ